MYQLEAEGEKQNDGQGISLTLSSKWIKFSMESPNPSYVMGINVMEKKLKELVSDNPTDNIEPIVCQDRPRTFVNFS